MATEDTYVTYKFLLTEIQKMSKEQKEDRHQLNNVMQNMFSKFDDKLDSIDQQVKYTNGKVKKLREDVDALSSKTVIKQNTNTQKGFFKKYTIKEIIGATVIASTAVGTFITQILIYLSDTKGL